MSETTEAERIQYRMNRIRRHLSGEVDGVVGSAEQLLDWRYYVERNPFACVAVSAIAGFFLVPGPRAPVERRIYLDADAARELAKNRREDIVVHHEEGASPGLLKSVALMASNALVRAAIAQFGQVVGKQISSSLPADGRHG
ncbi:MAG: hypothetical protein KDA80_03680 [Planctomycetaceae bacterium]|nr:hypothetical protein [Planctomycetaceae bacterium]